MSFIVKTVREMLSSKGLVLFFLMLCFFSFLYVKDVKAALPMPHKFPELDYLYSELNTFLKANPKYVNTLNQLIEKLNETDYKFIVFLARDNYTANQYRVYVHLGREEDFHITYKANALRYTTLIAKMGYATSVMNVEDWYYLKNGSDRELTEERVDNWVKGFVLNAEKMFEERWNLSFLDATYFKNTNDYQYFNSILIYNSMNKEKMNVYDYSNFKGAVLNGKTYEYAIPTFASIYPEYKFIEEKIPDYDYNDMPDISTDGEDQEFDTTDPDKIIEGNDAKKSMFNILSFMLDQFPIYKQIRTISERWRYYDSDCIKFGDMNEPYTKRCLVLDNLKFTFLNHKYDLPGLDVTWYLQYRNMIDFFIKLSVGLLTTFKSLHIIQGMFHGK